MTRGSAGRNENGLKWAKRFGLSTDEIRLEAKCHGRMVFCDDPGHRGYRVLWGRGLPLEGGAVKAYVWKEGKLRERQYWPARAPRAIDIPPLRPVTHHGLLPQTLCTLWIE